MAADDMVELWVSDVAEKVGDLVVRQMSVQRTDALFGRPRSARVSIEQVLVVVRFDEESVEMAKAFGDAAGDMPHVRGDPDFFTAIADHESDRIDRIMLDRKARDDCTANLKFTTGFEDFPCARLDACIVEKFFGLGGRVNRHLVLSQKDLKPLDVIAVFVSDQDAIDAGRIDADRLHSRRQLFGAQASVEHQPHATALDHCRVATTATAKHRKTHRRRD